MSWQDVIISVGSAIISLSLFANVRDPQKPPLTTSLPIAAILTVFVFVFASAAFWFTALVNVATASLWYTLAIQRFKQQRIPELR